MQVDRTAVPIAMTVIESVMRYHSTVAVVVPPLAETSIIRIVMAKRHPLMLLNPFRRIGTQQTNHSLPQLLHRHLG